MNALPSLDLPKQPSRSRKSGRLHRSPSSRRSDLDTNRHSVEVAANTSVRSRRKLNPAYARRRQGLEVVTKLITYSTLALLGTVTLVNSIGYNYAQQDKLQNLETEVQDAKIRTEKVNSNFIRANDAQAQKSVIQENTYKVAPDRLPVFLVSTGADRQLPKDRSK
jgi:hypothetical protein